jgi:hypothetical protein
MFCTANSVLRVTTEKLSGYRSAFLPSLAARLN